MSQMQKYFESPATETLITRAEGPAGTLPLSDEILRNWSSGDLFGLTFIKGLIVSGHWLRRRAQHRLDQLMFIHLGRF